MSIQYCHNCGKNIDTDFNAEHFDWCVTEPNLEPYKNKNKFNAEKFIGTAKELQKKLDENTTVRGNRTPENLEELKKEAYQEGFDKGRLYEAMLQKEPMPETYISNTTEPPHLNSRNLLERLKGLKMKEADWFSETIGLSEGTMMPTAEDMAEENGYNRAVKEINSKIDEFLESESKHE